MRTSQEPGRKDHRRPRVGLPHGRAVLATLLLAQAQAASPARAAAQPEEVRRYRVQAGDTLYGLARTHLQPPADWQALQRLNGVADPRRLRPGSELRLPLAWLRGEATTVTLTALSGEAWKERAREGAREPLAVGATLRAGDTLVVGEPGEARLALADGSRVLLAGGSRVEVLRLFTLGDTGLVRTRLKLLSGETEAQISTDRPAAAPFEIEAPLLTLGVRGTEFRVGVLPEGGGTRTEVLRGRVQAAPAAGRGGALLQAGQGTVREQDDRGAVAAQALPAAPGLPSEAPTLERLPITLHWTPPAEAAGAPAGYRAQVFAAGTGDTAADERLLDGRFSQPPARWSDLPDGRYRLRVRGIDAQGLEGRNAEQPFVVNVRPEPPFTGKPRDGAKVYGSEVGFDWSRPQDAARYRLQVLRDDDTGGAAPLVDRDATGETASAGPLPPGAYRWRLATIAADGEQGPWGDVARFELRETPPSPQGLGEPEARGDALVFRWRARQADDRYQAEVRRVGDDGTQPPVVATETGEPELELAGLPPGRYLLRVRTLDADGFAGPWGGAQGFDVPRSPWWWLLPLGAVLLIL